MTAPEQALLNLRADALEIFDGPECSQDVRDAIEWYSASVSAILDRAPAPAPTEQPARAEQWSRLYETASAVVARIGYKGEIDSRADEVESLMDALHDLDGGQWMPGLTPLAARAVLPGSPAPEVAPVPAEAMTDRIIAGVLFDFCGFLTTHETRWKFSAYDDAGSAVTAIKEFAERRNIARGDLDEAVVEWRAALSQGSDAERLEWMIKNADPAELGLDIGWWEGDEEYRSKYIAAIDAAISSQGSDA